MAREKELIGEREKEITPRKRVEFVFDERSRESVKKLVEQGRMKLQDARRRDVWET